MPWPLMKKRSLFSPTLWEKSNTVLKDENHQQQLEQCWFAGVHSNVGGGYADCQLSNYCLQWLIEKAEGAGLCFNEPPLIKTAECDKGELRNSYSPMYWFWLPKWRTIDLDNPLTNQTVHESVLERYNDNSKKYRPPNLKDFVAGADKGSLTLTQKRTVGNITDKQLQS